MKISIVIPNYNGRVVLEKNLPQVLKHAQGAELIVIDDASTDDSADYIKKNFPEIKLVCKKANTGFAKSCNLGVKKAKGEIIVLFNHDVYPKKDFLKPLLKHFEDASVFAAGCLEESREDKKVILRGRGVGQFSRGFLIHGRGEVDKTNTLWVSGGSGAFRKTIWQELGGFDPLFSPFYWEDIDLSYRAVKAGYKVAFEPQSRVIHEHYRGAIRKNYSNQEVKTIAYCNQFLFFWKNITDLKLWMSHFLWMPYHFIKAAIRFDWCFFTGFFQAFLKLNKVFSQKKQLKKLFKVKDHQIVAGFRNDV